MSDLALPYVLPRIDNPNLEFVKYSNLLKAFQARRGRTARVEAFPIDLTIDLTTSCQLRCPYCAVGNGTISRKKLIMKGEMYDRILHQVGDCSFIIWYFSTGEPLLHKRFADLVGRSKDKEIFSVISTNLSLKLSDDSLTELLLCGLGIISVSIDGATQETYSMYRRGGVFELVADNVQRMVVLKRKLGLTFPLIEWRFLRFLHNEHEESFARNLAEEWGVDLLEFWPGAAPPRGSPSSDGVFASAAPLTGPALSGTSLTRLAAAQAQERPIARLMPGFTSGANVDISKLTPKCDWLYYSGMIYPDGRVGPCCVTNDDNTDFVSSISDYTDYSEVFNSPGHIASRQMLRHGGRAGTVCDICPNPGAQHYQFRNKIRGVLRNAPPWAIKIVISDLDRFFLPEDRLLIPEVALLYDQRDTIQTEVESGSVYV
jgi:MoaA/NifB/PqqE/SkfB family radical SAM enzyme